MTEPLDEDYLLTFAREQQHMATPAPSGPYTYDKCCVCRHTWHGIRCDMSGCDCRTSYEAAS